jgi:hypothetical protein
MSDTITTKIEDEIPRHQPKNPFNYSKVELAKRKKAVSDAEKDYPNVPGLWIEWMYDLLEQKGEAEVNRIIESGEWEKQTNLDRQYGGTLKSCEILDN